MKIKEKYELYKKNYRDINYFTFHQKIVSWLSFEQIGKTQTRQDEYKKRRREYKEFVKYYWKLYWFETYNKLRNAGLTNKKISDRWIKREYEKIYRDMYEEYSRMFIHWYCWNLYLWFVKKWLSDAEIQAKFSKRNVRLVKENFTTIDFRYIYWLWHY